jgi:putative heme-binding domain-containing protein
LPPARSKVVRKWTVEELAAAWAKDLPRDPNRGKELFTQARCIACHRCGGPGGTSGPELASVSRRYAPRDLVTAILEPSRAIDEKYADDVFELTSGRVVTGRVVPGDYRAAELTVTPNLLEPEKGVTFAKTEIVARRPSSVSSMPAGLLDCFTEEEIVSLLSYLLAGGASAGQATSP